MTMRKAPLTYLIEIRPGKAADVDRFGPYTEAQAAAVAATIEHTHSRGPILSVQVVPIRRWKQFEDRRTRVRVKK